MTTTKLPRLLLTNLRDNATALIHELSLHHPGGCEHQCTTCQLVQHTNLTLSQIKREMGE